METHIEQKLQKARSIIREAINKFGIDKMAVAITGGKDSTTCLWIVREVCQELGAKLPICIFINEGDVFDEIFEFIEKLEKEWGIGIVFLENTDVINKANKVCDIIDVSDLNATNRMALQEIGFNDKSFAFVPDSYVCNHLLKTVPLRNFIRENGLKALVTAIRWDEQEARKNEDFFSPRNNPDHTRVHSILHLSERDIWITIFKYDIPYNKLYKLGYRSLGARCATQKISDIPAWMQDLENTPERLGRGQEKEKVMDQLRALGYM